MNRPASNRCKLHGGLSTGPRTEEGRKRIAESNARRGVLRDLAELAPEVEERQRERWTSAILVLAHWGGQFGLAGEAVGVSGTTVHRWSQKPAFAEALRRKRWRDHRRWRRKWRAEMRADAERRAREAAIRWFSMGRRRRGRWLRRMLWR